MSKKEPEIPEIGKPTEYYDWLGQYLGPPTRFVQDHPQWDIVIQGETHTVTLMGDISYVDHDSDGNLDMLCWDYDGVVYYVDCDYDEITQHRSNYRRYEDRYEHERCWLEYADSGEIYSVGIGC